MTENFNFPGGGQGAGPFFATAPGSRGMPRHPNPEDGQQSAIQAVLKPLTARQTYDAIGAMLMRAKTGNRTDPLLLLPPGRYYFPHGWFPPDAQTARTANGRLPPDVSRVPAFLEVMSVSDDDPFVAGAPLWGILQNGRNDWADFDRTLWRYDFFAADFSFHYQRHGAHDDVWRPMLASAGPAPDHVVSDRDFPADPTVNEDPPESPTVAPSRRSVWKAIKDLLTFFITNSEVWLAVIGGDSGNAALPDTAQWQDLPNPEHRENKGADEIRVTTSGAGFDDNGPYTADTAAIKLASTTEDGDGVVIHSENMAFLHVRWLAADEKFQINTLGPNGANINFGANITVAEVEFFFAQPITATAAELVDLQHKVEALEAQQRGIVFHVRRFVEVPKGTDGDNLRLNGGTFPANFRGNQELNANPVLSLADDAETPAYTVYKGFPANYDEATSDVFQFTLVYDSNDLPDEDAPWLFDGKRDPATAEETLELATVDVVGGNSGVAILDDKAMPVALPLPYDLGAADLAGVLNASFRAGTGGQIIVLVPFDVATLPNAEPASNPANPMPGEGYLLDSSGIAHWRIWKDGDAIKVDSAVANVDRTSFFTSLTIQIPVAKAAELGADGAGAGLRDNRGGVVWGCPNRRPDGAANRIRRRARATAPANPQPPHSISPERANSPPPKSPLSTPPAMTAAKRASPALSLGNPAPMPASRPNPLRSPSKSGAPKSSALIPWPRTLKLSGLSATCSPAQNGIFPFPFPHPQSPKAAMCGWSSP